MVNHCSFVDSIMSIANFHENLDLCIFLGFPLSWLFVINFPGLKPIRLRNFFFWLKIRLRNMILILHSIFLTIQQVIVTCIYGNQLIMASTPYKPRFRASQNLSYLPIINHELQKPLQINPKKSICRHPKENFSSMTNFSATPKRPGN